MALKHPSARVASDELSIQTSSSPTCSSDIQRQLPRLQKQPERVHDAAGASGFRH